MSKERLEEITLEEIKRFYEGTATVYIKWLIEQAERVEDNDQAIVDLNKHVEDLEDENADLKREIKRYREALEYMLNGKSSDYSTTENMLDDYLFIARKALEVESSETD